MKNSKAPVLKQIGITISKPETTVTTIRIVGITDLVSNRFSQEAQKMIEFDMQNNTTKAAKKERQKPRDFKADAEASLYRSSDGWYGMPVNAFKAAMVRAGQLAGVEMTILKQCLHVLADGVDASEPHIQLVRIYGEPEYFTRPTRTHGKPNVASAGRFRPGWRVKLNVEHEEAFISRQSVANLLLRAGKNVGVGAGRNMSKDSIGMGWGVFEPVLGEEEKK